jgi:hypothetical protein
MKSLKIRNTGFILLAAAVFVGWQSSAKAQVQVDPLDLAAAGGYAVLGPTITFAGADTVTGDIGAATINGSPVVLNGTNQLDDSLTQSAQNALSTAYSAAANASYSGVTNYGVVDLGGQTLTPGAYNFSSTLAITTAPLVLNGAGVYIFQVGTTLTTASNITLENGAQASDIFWVVGSATLGTNSNFAGTVLADTSITADTGASMDGGLLAVSGAVTLSGNNNVMAAAPEPAVTTLLIAGFAGLIIVGDRIRRHYSERNAI